MSTIDLITTSAAVSGQVNSITNDTPSTLQAAGYAAFIYSVTGSNPMVANIGNGRAKILLTDSQIIKMQQWIAERMQSKGSKLTVELSPVFAPMVAKKATPYAIALFAIGAIAGSLLFR